jgi:hypothetical protein
VIGVAASRAKESRSHLFSPYRGANSQVSGARSQDCKSAVRYSLGIARNWSCAVVQHLARACLTRDDLLFWLSLIWLVGLCCAAVWAFFAL